MREEEFETSIKVLLVGNGAVGKSSMIQRYCKGVFTKDYKKTIGVDFLERQLQVHGEDVRLMLWDTAGQEEFDSITKSYYRGAHACVLAFSTTDRRSFEDVAKWKEKVAEECGDIAMVLIQNKIDLLEEAVVEASEVEELAKCLKLKLYRTSVKDDYNVNEVFLYLAERYLEILSKMESSQTHPSDTKTIGLFSAEATGLGVQAMANSEGEANNAEMRKKTRAKNDSQATESSFQLRPNKMRTGGKKNKLLCTVL